MPTLKIEYQILLSSPSDVPEERLIAADIVAELNKVWAEPAGAVLRLLRWEDVAPGFAQDGQDVINRSLGERWDVYLGIMHARFGAPTPRFGSGTEEEFSRAYTLWSQQQERRRIMFYFKKAPVDFDSIDSSQIELVRKFKETLKGRGGLYKEFPDANAFRDMLRAHLAGVLAELHRSAPPHDASAAVSIQAIADSVAEAPEGFVDLMEKTNSGLAAAGAILGQVGELMSQSTKEMEESTAEVKDALERGDLAALKKATTSMSRHLTRTAIGLGEIRREYGSKSRAALDAFSTVISIAKSAASGEKIEAVGLVASMNSASSMMQILIDTIVQTERSISSAPNLSKDFAAARMSLRRELGLFRTELNGSIALIRELVIILSE